MRVFAWGVDGVQGLKGITQTTKIRKEKSRVEDCPVETESP